MSNFEKGFFYTAVVFILFIVIHILNIVSSIYEYLDISPF